MGKAWPMRRPAPSSEETGSVSPENWLAGVIVAMAVPNRAAICVRVNAETRRPNPVVVTTYRHGGGRERGQAALDRDAEREHGQRQQDAEAHHRDGHVRQLLAEQELEAGHRGHVEIGDRAELLLPHDRQRGQDRRDEQQQQRDGAGHHRVEAPEILVVAVAHLEDGAGPARGSARGGQPGQVVLMRALHIAADGLAPERHGAVHPHADLGRAPAREVAPEAGRDLDRQRELAAAQTPVDVGGGRQTVARRTK